MEDVMIENLLHQQFLLNEAIMKLLTNMKKDSAERKSSTTYFKNRMETLQSYWKDFESNHEKLIAVLDESCDYITKNVYQETTSLYEQAYKYIMLKGLPSQQTASNPPKSPSTSTGEKPVLTIPKMSTQGNNSKLDDMMKKQTCNFRAFQRTITTIDLDSIEEKWEMEDMLKTLNARWTAIDTLHWEIDGEIEGTNQIYEQVFSSLERNYNTYKKAINSKLWSVGHRETSTPQIEIPVFNGNYHQWISFKDLFTETIHKNPSLSNAQKMQFLKGKVKGEAERLIKHLKISSDNYVVCWEILNHRYNNMKLIFSSHANILLNLSSAQQASVAHIKKIHDTTKECLNAISNLGIDISTWDPLLVHILSQKLDPETHEDYMSSLSKPRDLPSLQDFLEFIELKFTTMESSRRKQESGNQKTNSQASSSQKQVNNATTQEKTNNNKDKERKISCPICYDDHGIYFCTQFANMLPNLKLRAVTKLSLCDKCLHNHKGKECKTTKKCRNCNGSHNTLLHDAFAKPTSNSTSGAGGVTSKNAPPSHATNFTETNQQANNINSHVTHGDVPEILLATAMIKVQGQDGTQRMMRALIDQGSQTSLITENAAQQLGLPRNKCKGVITGIGTKTSNCKGMITINCNSIHSPYTFNTDVIVMKSLTNNLPSFTFSKPTWDYLENIELADPEFYVSRPIDILFGADVYSNIIMEGICRVDASKPIAQQTRLGWILCGNVRTFHCNVVLHNMNDLQKFWEIEDILEETSLPSEDDECIKLYQSSTQRRLDGRYEVRLPLKSEINTELGSSKHIAIAQLKQLERKFHKQKNIAQEYKLFVDEYLSLGHMKPAIGHHEVECFLPHHCVLREGSSTTALRVVFNASGKTSNGTSLNDFMFKGPNLQKDLQTLILSWRQYRIGFTADIEKMFRQIWVHEEDQPLQKIVWRNTPTEPIQNLQLTTVTYGTKSAPFLAMMTLKQLAKDESHNYQEAANVLENCFYMDDLLHGSHEINAALKLKQDLIDLLKSGGFNLRKWSSNDPKLTNSGIDGQQDNFHFKRTEVTSTKTLSLNWNPTKDMFSFQTRIDTDCTKITKRTLLSDISKLFDPLGWLTPLTTKLKLIFQKLWLHDIQWDDQLPEEITSEWIQIRDDIQNINQIQIPRWLGTKPNKLIEIHGFCDASTKAYGCVVYCKIIQDNVPKVTLVVGKARLVPLKKVVTLPRLELCGALLLSRLIAKVRKGLADHEVKVYGWTDSTAVLGWLQGDPSRWNTFVANRVRQVTEEMPPNSWGYVKSADNPADSTSRGLTVNQLQQHSLWWNGPLWLPRFKPLPSHRPIFETNEERKIIKQSNTVQTTCEDDNLINNLLNKYSSLSKVVRILSWIRRFTASKQTRKQVPYITLQEMHETKLVIVKQVQLQFFQEEIDCLSNNNEITSKSKISKLSPILDNGGILRVGGRLNNAHISPEMRQPIILPQKSRLTDLIIDHAHILTFHGGARLTTSLIRQKYWIVGGNRATKRRIRLCVTCRKQKPEFNTQIMGDLPTARVNPSRPFSHTGVDFTGHVSVKSNKGRGIKTSKGYVAIFVCMVTKAVHLELVSDLTTSSFIAALRRMDARRGMPQHIYSDNSRNFLGAHKILKKEYEDLQQIFNEEFMAQVNEMEINWHFNAPAWPTAGGLWEAAVKSFKFHLKRVLGDQVLTYEEFSTLLAQIEACLNSRPLCPITEDPEDLDFLTPAHFLTSGAALTVIETERDMRTRWQLSQKILQDIWKRWHTEYLSQLNTRSKWLRPRRNIEINDVVMIHDDNLPPGQWAMGRVIDAHPGKDGVVRVVSLKTKNGLIKRPVMKLSILPVKEEDDSNDKQVSNENPRQSTVLSGTFSNKPRWFNFKATTIFFLVMIMSASQGAVNITRFSENKSLYFDKIANMQLITDTWKLVVYYDMDPYWQGTKAFKTYLTALEEMCRSHPVTQSQTHCDVIELQLQHGLSELEYYNQLLLSQHNARSSYNTRHKRGLINGVGYVANQLFGVLDERFAEQYRKDIMLLQDNQKHMAALWKNQTSIVESEFNILKRTENVMNRQHKIINQHIFQIKSAINTLKSQVQANIDFNELTLGAIIASNMLHDFKNMQNMLLDTVTDIYHGRVNLHLIAPEQLKHELSTISNQLSQDMALPVDNLQENLRNIYSLLNVRTRVLEKYLIFEVSIPLIQRDTYEIMKIIPIPHIRQDKMVSLAPVSDLISINLKKDTYIPMTESDVRSCTITAHVYLCHVSKPVHHMRSDKSLCEKETSCEPIINKCKDMWQDSYTVNTYIYFCCELCQIRVMCGDQITAHQLTQSGLITIDNGCIVKSEKFTVFTHKQHHSELMLKTGMYIPPIIAPINHVFNLTIPEEIEENKTQILMDSQEMRELGERIKHLKNVEIQSSSISFHDVHHYAMIYFILGVVLLGGSIIAIRRFKCNWSVSSAPTEAGSRPHPSEHAAAPAQPPRAAVPAPSAARREPSASRDISLSPHFKRSYFKKPEDVEDFI